MDESKDLNQIQKSQTSWFSAHHVLGWSLLVLAFAGLVAWAYVMQTSQKADTSTPVQHQSVTPQTYLNNHQQYKFTYPGNWTLTPYSILSPEVNYGWLIYLNSPQNNDAAKEIRAGRMYSEGFKDDIEIKVGSAAAAGIKDLESYIKGPAGIEISNPAKTTLNGVPAYEFTRGGFGAYYTVIALRKGLFYEIAFGNAANRAALTEEEKSILDSFQFLTEVDTTGWKTYQSDELGIKFQYPNDWNDLKLKIGNGETYNYSDHPETVKGKTFVVSYKFKGADNEWPFLTGISADFQTNREGMLLDNRGFEKRNGKYYFKYIQDSEFEIPSNLVSEVKGADATGIFIEPSPQQERFLPYGNNFAAVFNLKSSKDFDGVLFNYLATNAQNDPTVWDLERPIFKKILETVEIY